MYKVDCNEVTNKHEMEELVKMFIMPSDYFIFNNREPELSKLCMANKERAELEGEEICEIRVPDGIQDKNKGKQFLYDYFSAETGKTLDWGIHTGVRPGKMIGEWIRKGKSLSDALLLLKEEYYLSDEKIALLEALYQTQKGLLNNASPQAAGIYIGIPFCPTRCVYCSFTSNQGTDAQIQSYLEALLKEINFVSEKMKQTGMYAESIYIGGGTPTTLDVPSMRRLLEHAQAAFCHSGLKEFTVEAGRPDTITREKLELFRQFPVNRISINPQTMKEHTLGLIGRNHSPQQIVEAFELANEVGIPMINADLIAGLPEETPEDFEDSLEQIIRLKPENITVHTLAIKRASRLKMMDANYSYHQGQIVGDMLSISDRLMKEHAYAPYYMYRQKQMSGNFENVGYGKKGTESIYNIRIMEENQTIIALGAGGISKVYYPAENRLERVPNVSNYEIYIERLEEMLQRKEMGIFYSQQ